MPLLEGVEEEVSLRSSLLGSPNTSGCMNGLLEVRRGLTLGAGVGEVGAALAVEYCGMLAAASVV